MKKIVSGSCVLVLIGVLLASLFGGCVTSHKGIKTLIDMGKDANYHDGLVQSETQRYEKVRLAIQEGEISEGISAAEFVKEYGEPVIAMKKGGQTAYVYKHGESTWFSPKKIYLYFDEAMNLIDWKCDKSLCKRQQAA